MQVPALWPLDPQKAARFLKANPFVCKKALGEFFGSRSKIKAPRINHMIVALTFVKQVTDPGEPAESVSNSTEAPDFSMSTLQEFIASFNWAGVPFDRALREMLHSFRLPGESQMIDRIMQAFASHYTACNPDTFDDADTGYTLAFSLMMLNTDLHNDSIKTKMSCAGFIKNNRGIGAGGADLDEKFLESLFKSIQQNEIRMVGEWAPDELGVFEWEELVHIDCEYMSFDNGTWGNRQEGLLFGASWSGTVAALSVVLEAPEVPC